jgi:hypothetical protein
MSGTATEPTVPASLHQHPSVASSKSVNKRQIRRPREEQDPRFSFPTFVLYVQWNDKRHKLTDMILRPLDNLQLHDFQHKWSISNYCKTCAQKSRKINKQFLEHRRKV